MGEKSGVLSQHSLTTSPRSADDRGGDLWPNEEVARPLSHGDGGKIPPSPTATLSPLYHTDSAVRPINLGGPYLVRGYGSTESISVDRTLSVVVDPPNQFRWIVLRFHCPRISLNHRLGSSESFRLVDLGGRDVGVEVLRS